MASLSGFDASKIDPAEPMDPLPPGDYVVVVTATEMKQTKMGDGEYLQVEMQVVDGAFKGRKLWDRMNLKNPNEQAVEIARKTLSALCRAVGVLTPRDSAELHNIPLLAKVATKKREDNGEIGNVVKGYMKKGGAAASAPGRAAPTGAPPWKR